MAEDAAIDQVLTSKLDARFLDGGIIEHSKLGHHQASEESKVTKEQWIPDQETPTLSRSGRSTILLQRSEDSPIKVRAVKEIHKSIGEDDYVDYSKELEAIVKFSRSSHSHLFVQTYGWFENSTSVFITMEYFELRDLSRQVSQPLPVQEAHQIVSQLLDGLDYMHSQGLVHRDLKLSNIMVVSKTPSWVVKIADFGTARMIKRDQDATTTRPMGTVSFASPEQLGVTRPNPGYESATDMWSLGVIIFKLLTYTTPFEAVYDLVGYVSGKTHLPMTDKLPPDTPLNISEMIRDLLSVEPQNRPSARACSKKDWSQVSLEPQDDRETDWSVPVESSSELNINTSEAEKQTLPIRTKTEAAHTTQPTKEGPPESKETKLQIIQKSVQENDWNRALPHIKDLVENIASVDETDKQLLISLVADTYLGGHLPESICFDHPEIRAEIAKQNAEELGFLEKEGRYKEIISLLEPYKLLRPQPELLRDTSPRMARWEVEFCDSHSLALFHLKRADESIQNLSISLEVPGLAPAEKGILHHSLALVSLSKADWSSAKEHGKLSFEGLREVAQPNHDMILDSLKIIVTSCGASDDPDFPMWSQTLAREKKQAATLAGSEPEASGKGNKAARSGNKDKDISRGKKDLLDCQREMAELFSSYPSMAAERGTKYIRKHFKVSFPLYRRCDDCIQAYFMDNSCSITAKTGGSFCEKHKNFKTDMPFSPLHFFSISRQDAGPLSGKYRSCVEEVQCLVEQASNDENAINRPLRFSPVKAGHFMEITPIWLAALDGNHQVVDYLLSLKAINPYEGYKSPCLLPSLGIPNSHHALILRVFNQLSTTSALRSVGSYLPMREARPNPPWVFASASLLDGVLQKCKKRTREILVPVQVREGEVPVQLPLIHGLATLPVTVVEHQNSYSSRLELFETLVKHGVSVVGGSAIKVFSRRLGEALELLLQPSPQSRTVDVICGQVSDLSRICRHIHERQPDLTLNDIHSSLLTNFEKLRTNIHREIQKVMERHTNNDNRGLRKVFRGSRLPELTTLDYDHKKTMLNICVAAEDAHALLKSLGLQDDDNSIDQIDGAYQPRRFFEGTENDIHVFLQEVIPSASAN
ncbi:unnamed protein product [Clonostachys solani]|uniref:Autophagy-related protein 1 n=1 Tax=Clonostachys solani TaxID=160281 RepID=A0A9N9ZHX5_9HYPO|nr:unnamed protein product [Clonostachys solani]